MIKRTIFFLFISLFAVCAHAQGSGDVIYISKCAMCHGANGAGKTAFAQKARVPDLASPEVQSLSDAQIHDSIARGTGHKAYPHAFAARGMSPGDIESLVKKIREFAKK